MRDLLGRQAGQPLSRNPSGHFVGAVFLHPRQSGQIGGAGDRAARNQVAVRGDHVAGFDQVVGLQPRPMPVAKPDRNIDTARRQIDHFGRRVQHQVDVGMGLSKPVQARHHPVRRKAGRNRDLQRAGLIRLGQRLDPVGDGPEPIGQNAGQLATLGGQRNAAPIARHQGRAQMAFQPANLLTDRRMADVQHPPRSRIGSRLGQGGKGA